MSQQTFRIDSIRIDDICRTERYYTATLLPFILLNDNFSGLLAFLETLASRGVQAVKVGNQEPTLLWCGEEFNHVELVTEMDIVRDTKFYSSWLDGLDKVAVDKSDMLRPDVVIIINSLLLVVEGKFFGKMQPRQKAKEQILAQRKIIEDIILQFPGYEFDRYCHIYLSPENHFKPGEIECQAVLTWEDIRQLSERVIGAKHYVTRRLAKAIDLHHLVVRKSTDETGKVGKNYRGKLPLSEIVTKCQMEGENILVGYHGGASTLRTVDPRTLTERRFKWDMTEDPIPPKDPRNWILGSNFIKILNGNLPDSVGEDSRGSSKSTDETGKVGKNYRGKLSLSEIVTKCRMEGENILVGYYGGASALRTVDPRTLTERRFKWDMTEDPIPPKDPRNWIPGGDFIKIVSDKLPDFVR